MEVNEAIAKRRSIRKYKDKEVDEILIRKIIDAARLAPSAKNRQPWLFKITTKEEKNKIADIMIKYDQANVSISSSISFTANVIKEAKELIIVLYKMDKNWKDYDLLSIGAAIENMILEAENIGLSTLWIGDTIFVNKEICKELDINKYDIVSAVAVGYKNQDPKPRPRKTIDEILI